MTSSETPGSGTGTMDPVELPWLEWDPEGSPVSIHLSPAVAEALGRVTAGNANNEIGGLLLGRVEAGERPAVWIEGCQQIPHDAGEEFILDSEETAALETTAREVVATGKFAVVGLYRSHRRPGFQLEEPDFDLMRRYFRDASDLILLIRPSSEKVSAQFHVWDERNGARAVGAEVPLAENSAKQSTAPASAAPREVPAERPRRLVPDFVPTPVEPAPSVLGLSGAYQRRQGTLTDDLTSEQGGQLKRWLPLLAALIIVGGVVWFFIQPALHTFSSPPTGQATEVVNRPLGLYVNDTGGPVWQVSWNPNATALHQARSVRLFVREASQPGGDDSGADGPNLIDLSPRDLAAGTYQYRPVSNDVTFRLEVTDQTGRVSAESFRLVRTAAPTPTAPKPPRPTEDASRIVQPRATYRAPAVVAAGVRSRIRGMIPIDIRVQIDTRGRVTSATPVAKQHTGIDEYLAARAVQAAKKWRFEPARENGKPVDGTQILHFVFEK